MKTNRHTIAFALLALGGLAMPAGGAVLTFVDDYPGFVAAAGPLSSIDFETLPDGSPSVVLTQITETFNYDLQGAHFTALGTIPIITGNPIGGFHLSAILPLPERASLVAESTTPSLAVGVLQLGPASLVAYSSTGDVIGTATVPTDAGAGQFAGIVSTEVPIARVVVASRGHIASISEFQFSVVPEPTSLGCLACSMIGLAAKRRGAKRG